jgi:biopolymer transport protein TolR
MAFNTQSTQELKSDINVTPLVDVMLVMLIIFMLVTPMLQKGVGVELPRAKNVTAVPESKEKALLVVLKSTGELYVEDDPVDPTTLVRALRSRLESTPGLQLQVKADRNVRYSEVKRIIRAGQEVGFHGASLIAEEIRPTGPAAGSH